MPNMDPNTIIDGDVICCATLWYACCCGVADSLIYVCCVCQGGCTIGVPCTGACSADMGDKFLPTASVAVIPSKPPCMTSCCCMFGVAVPLWARVSAGVAVAGCSWLGWTVWVLQYGCSTSLFSVVLWYCLLAADTCLLVDFDLAVLAVFLVFLFSLLRTCSSVGQQQAKAISPTRRTGTAYIKSKCWILSINPIVYFR